MSDKSPDICAVLRGVLPKGSLIPDLIELIAIESMKRAADRDRLLGIVQALAVMQSEDSRDGWCTFCRGGDGLHERDPLPHRNGCVWRAAADYMEEGNG